MITAIILFIIAAVLVVLGILQFRERGFLFNNAYIYASEEERKTMNKKPYYRQTAIVFWILGAVFIVVGLSIVLNNGRLLYAEIPLFAGLIIYAVVSTVRINRQDKK